MGMGTQEEAFEVKCPCEAKVRGSGATVTLEWVRREGWSRVTKNWRGGNGWALDGETGKTGRWHICARNPCEAMDTKWYLQMMEAPTHVDFLGPKVPIDKPSAGPSIAPLPVSYTHLRAHET